VAKQKRNSFYLSVVLNLGAGHNLERHRFEVHDVECWREHFQKTLEHWANRLWENREKGRAEIGWPKMRLWLAYFSLFAVAFDRNTVSVFQTLASKRRT